MLVFLQLQEKKYLGKYQTKRDYIILGKIQEKFVQSNNYHLTISFKEASNYSDIHFTDDEAGGQMFNNLSQITQSIRHEATI